jgi:hypothetical protein
MSHWFRGMETAGVELFGSVEASVARALVDAPFALEETDGGRVRASVFAIDIRDLSVLGLPLVRFSYPEVLWLLHVRSSGGPYRLAVRAHTKRSMLAPLSLLDRYDSREADIAIERKGSEGSVAVRTRRAGLELRFRGSRAAEPRVIERLFTRARSGAMYEIPWAAEVPEETRAVSFDVVDRSLVDEIFGASMLLDGEGAFYGNRRHACSPAANVSA